MTMQSSILKREYKTKTPQMIFAKIKRYKGEVLLQDVVDILRALDENIDTNIEVAHICTYIKRGLNITTKISVITKSFLRGPLICDNNLSRLNS